MSKKRTCRCKQTYSNEAMAKPEPEWQGNMRSKPKTSNMIRTTTKNVQSGDKRQDASSSELKDDKIKAVLRHESPCWNSMEGKTIWQRHTETQDRPDMIKDSCNVEAHAVGEPERTHMRQFVQQISIAYLSHGQQQLSV